MPLGPSYSYCLTYNLKYIGTCVRNTCASENPAPRRNKSQIHIIIHIGRGNHSVQSAVTHKRGSIYRLYTFIKKSIENIYNTFIWYENISRTPLYLPHFFPAIEPTATDPLYYVSYTFLNWKATPGGVSWNRGVRKLALPHDAWGSFRYDRLVSLDLIVTSHSPFWIRFFSFRSLFCIFLMERDAVSQMSFKCYKDIRPFLCFTCSAMKKYSQRKLFIKYCSPLPINQLFYSFQFLTEKKYMKTFLYFLIFKKKCPPFERFYIFLIFIYKVISYFF